MLADALRGGGVLLCKAYHLLRGRLVHQVPQGRLIHRLFRWRETRCLPQGHLVHRLLSQRFKLFCFEGARYILCFEDAECFIYF